MAPPARSGATTGKIWLPGFLHQRQTVGRPAHVPVGVQALGIDVEIAAASVAPGHDGARGAVGRDRRIDLVVHRRADRDPIAGPGHFAPGLDPLGIEVLAAVARILPGDDDATGGVGNDHRLHLVTGGAADGGAVARAPDDESVALHMHGVKVKVEVERVADWIFVPHHDGAADDVGGHGREAHIAERRVQDRAVGAPLGNAAERDALGHQADAAVAQVAPDSDGAAGTVGDQRAVGKVAVGHGQAHAASGPEDAAVVADALCVESGVGFAPVQPDDDGPADVVTEDGGVGQAAEEIAEGDPVGPPQGGAVCGQALRIHLLREGAIVTPGDHRAAGGDGGHHRALLGARRGADRDVDGGVGRPGGTRERGNQQGEPQPARQGGTRYSSFRHAGLRSNGVRGST